MHQDLFHLNHWNHIPPKLELSNALLTYNNIHLQLMTKHKASIHPLILVEYEIPKLSGKKKLQVDFFLPFLHLLKSKFRQIPPFSVEK